MAYSIPGIPVDRSNMISEIFTVYDFDDVPAEEPHDERYPFWQLTYLSSGKATYTVNGETFPVTAGEILFRRAGRVSRLVCDHSAKASLSIICFSGNDSFLVQFPDPPVRLYGDETATFLDLVRTGVRICRPMAASGFRLHPDTPKAALEFVAVSLERFLLMVYCRLTGIRSLTDESEKSNRHTELTQTASSIHRYLREHVKETISIRMLSQTFGLGQTALMKLYKREFGVSVLQDFTRMKLSYAKQRIRGSAVNFSQIAEELGFSSEGYFSRVFRKQEGITPTEWSRSISKRTG